MVNSEECDRMRVPKALTLGRIRGSGIPSGAPDESCMGAHRMLLLRLLCSSECF